MKDYVQIANRYIDDVLGGAIPACQFVKQACQRQLNDLQVASGTSFEYEFNPKLAARVCLFIEKLRHVKGPLAGQNIKLEPWQIFILTTLFGWTYKGERRRRFRRSYIEVPRGNAKSTLAAGVGLYMMTVDGEGGAGCYSFATSRDQAREVFDVAKEMIRRNSEARLGLGVRAFEHSLVHVKSASHFQPKQAQGNTLDGLNTHFACIDELHAHKTREVYDVVETSIGKRTQPLLFVITTAGFDQTGICYEVRSFVQKVLARETQANDQFGIIYTIDQEDDWTKESSLIKANPNWGVSVIPETVLASRDKALVLPSAANNFKTKHLDVWCNAATAWMDMQAWDACARDIRIEDFSGQECYIGLDLGAKNDLTAKVKVFPVENPEGRMEYYVFGDYYVPRSAVEKSANSQYSGWGQEDWLHVTDGGVTDFARVEEELREDLSAFKVQSIAYDPWQATLLATRLTEDGAPMAEYANNVKNMSDPMKWLEALVMDHRLVHNGDPVLRWMMANVVARRDAKDNIFPRKEQYENKIDGAVALIMALGMCVNEDSIGFEDYEASADKVFFSW